MLYFQRFSGKGTEKKPLLIILHSLFGSSDNWRTWGRRLSDHFDVILPDIRNHGKSFTAPGMNYTDLADDVVDIIESVNRENRDVHLLGHSMGGKIAMIVALMHTDLITSLVVGDIGPKHYPPTHREVIKGLTALSNRVFETRKEADLILSTHIKDSNLRSFLLKNIPKGNNGYALSDGISELIASYSDILAWPEFSENDRFDGPVLFLKGEISSYLEEHDKQAIMKLFPNASIAVIEDSGHLFHMENPLRVEEELTKFYRL